MPRPPSARLGALGLVHPFPSVLVAVSTGVIGLMAGGSLTQAAILVVAMAAFQASIGVVNDLRDASDDAIGQPWKPIPSGRVTMPVARRVAVAAGGNSLCGFRQGGAVVVFGLVD